MEELEAELEIEMSSVDELSVLSLELPSDFALQDESNTAMLNSSTNKVNKTLILFQKFLFLQIRLSKFT